jgi:hypothetical protein
MRKRGRITRKKQKGGVYISGGSFGAVFTPPPCLKNDTSTYEDDEIGKLMSKVEAEKEKLIVQRVMMALPEKASEYSFKEYRGECTPDTANPDLTSHPILLQNIANKTILRYPYGGVPLLKMVNYITEDDPSVTKAKVNKRVIFIINQLHSLFYGLKDFGDYGIIHRDIKPDNVVVSESGAMRYIDFGLALFKDEIEAPGQRRYGYDSLSYLYWPLECLFCLGPEGIFFCQEKNKELARQYLFFTKEQRYSPAGTMTETYHPRRKELLGLLGIPYTDAGQKQLIDILFEETEYAANYLFTAHFPDLHAIFTYMTAPVAMNEGAAGGGGAALVPSIDKNRYRVVNIKAMYDYLVQPENPAEAAARAPIKARLFEFNRMCKVSLLEKFDVFSLGITIGALFAGIKGNLEMQKARVPPFERDRVGKAKIAEDYIFSLAVRMLNPRFTQRPSAEGILREYEAARSGWM